MRSAFHRLAVRGTVLAVALLTPTVASAQGRDGMEARATRPALEERLSLYDRAAESPAYSTVLRDEAREQADQIRQRLDQGDFRPGDRLFVSVESYPELSDTFAGAADQKLIRCRSISAAGVGLPST